MQHHTAHTSASGVEGAFKQGLYDGYHMTSTWDVAAALLINALIAGLLIRKIARWLVR